ncbi:MAG: ORF6N domain-containing protein [FCB group bacterium]|jgi:hypothetical protein
MNEIALREDNLINRIHLIRGEKVILDVDLALLYEVETRVLKQAVKRNMKRFPNDFMFELTKKEYDSLRSQFVTLKRGEHSKYLPFAFTEQGVAMLSGVLKSDKAIEVNIAIMRTFVQLRRYAGLHKEIFERLDNLEAGFESLKDLVKTLLIQEVQPKRPIGFVTEA